MIPLIFKKLFSRDFTLGMFEVWYRGEITVPRKWTKRQNPDRPCLIFHRNGLNVDSYYGQDGTGWWDEREILRMIDLQKGFCKKIGREYLKCIEKIQDTIETQPTFSMEELKRYLTTVINIWPWFQAVWVAVDALERTGERKSELEYLLRVRKQTGEMVPATDAIIRKSIQAAFPRLGGLAEFLLLKEAYGGKLPSRQMLKRRRKGYYYTDGKLYAGATRKMIESLYGIGIESIEARSKHAIIQGKVAYKGRVTGRVRKVLGIKQVPEFKRGEVLIASMTTPDLLPAMHKAAAIVTDEGGIVSHAAIMARELKKPCIIGTKVATRVLKDGDMVEVDAENGIVRVL